MLTTLKALTCNKNVITKHAIAAIKSTKCDNTRTKNFGKLHVTIAYTDTAVFIKHREFWHITSTTLTAVLLNIEKFDTARCLQTNNLRQTTDKVTLYMTSLLLVSDAISMTKVSSLL